MKYANFTVYILRLMSVDARNRASSANISLTFFNTLLRVPQVLINFIEYYKSYTLPYFFFFNLEKEMTEIKVEPGTSDSQREPKN